MNFTLENRGINRSDPLWPNRPPKPEKWAFKNSFTIYVHFSKQDVDDEKNKEVLVVDPIFSLYTFGPETNSQNAYFFVCGNISKFFGLKMFIFAHTGMLHRGEKIELNRNYESDTVLASQISQRIDISIGPLADVNMKVIPKFKTVILGQLETNTSIEISVTTKSGQNESFVDGFLAVNLGESAITLINAISHPVSLVSCRQQSKQMVIY